MLSEMLHAQPGWERSGSAKGPFDLLFAKVHGMDVPYDALGPTQAVNYFRGCQVLTRKAETHRPHTAFVPNQSSHTGVWRAAISVWIA